MSRPLAASVIAKAYVSACRLDVEALKPGNVHVHAAGHGMQVSDFLESAEVSAPFIADPALSVGTRVRRAVEATFDAVGCNTNLGIVLLAAPLAAAFGDGPVDLGLAERLAQVLDSLDHEDACEVYKAIARANPAGLGTETGRLDVRGEPPAGARLRELMCRARTRDLIAEEHCTAFALVRHLSEDYEADLARGTAPAGALSRLFLKELARRLDTHIVRKHGPDAAERVRRAAEKTLAETEPLARDGWSNPPVTLRLLALDTALKSDGLNPGALADISAAAALLTQLKRLASSSDGTGVNELT
jgi:triphosphoribosyl-dephospho-CoA synthase